VPLAGVSLTRIAKLVLERRRGADDPCARISKRLPEKEFSKVYSLAQTHIHSGQLNVALVASRVFGRRRKRPASFLDRAVAPGESRGKGSPENPSWWLSLIRLGL